MASLSIRSATSCVNDMSRMQMCLVRWSHTLDAPVHPQCIISIDMHLGIARLTAKQNRQWSLHGCRLHPEGLCSESRATLASTCQLLCCRHACHFVACLCSSTCMPQLRNICERRYSRHSMFYLHSNNEMRAQGGKEHGSGFRVRVQLLLPILNSFLSDAGHRKGRLQPV